MPESRLRASFVVPRGSHPNHNSQSARNPPYQRTAATILLASGILDMLTSAAKYKRRKDRRSAIKPAGLITVIS